MVGSDMLYDTIARLRQWLFAEVLPLWQEQGVDWKNGGFYEKLDADARPVPDISRRTRVVARQIYSFAAAGRMGWPGDWKIVIEHGAQSLFEDCIMLDGLVVSTYTHDKLQGNPAFDLYDHAFALFALSELAGYEGYHERAENAAIRMLDAMTARFSAPKGGWLDAEEGEPLLRSNPHMHLLEAMLALDKRTADTRWIEVAGRIVALALKYFIAPSSGALHEYFDLDWVRYPDERGRIVEPGHQFEWAWLLNNWRMQSSPQQAGVTTVVERLCHIGEQFGVTKTGFVIDELWDDLRPKAMTSRTWPQTERVKACLQQAQLSTSASSARRWEESAAQAIEAILRFAHKTNHKGLWFDRVLADGTLLIEPAPASSLYHIMCAAEVADNYLAATRQNP